MGKNALSAICHLLSQQPYFQVCSSPLRENAALPPRANHYFLKSWGRVRRGDWERGLNCQLLPNLLQMMIKENKSRVMCEVMGLTDKSNKLKDCSLRCDVIIYCANESAQWFSSDTQATRHIARSQFSYRSTLSTPQVLWWILVMTLFDSQD